MLSLAGDLAVLAGLTALLVVAIVCTLRINRNRKMRIRSHRIIERLLNRE
jgi:hypothetical protein